MNIEHLLDFIGFLIGISLIAAYVWAIKRDHKCSWTQAALFIVIVVVIAFCCMAIFVL